MSEDKKKTEKNIKNGCIGCVVLVFIIGVIGAFITGGYNKDGSSEKADKSNELNVMYEETLNNEQNVDGKSVTQRKKLNRDGSWSSEDVAKSKPKMSAEVTRYFSDIRRIAGMGDAARSNIGNIMADSSVPDLRRVRQQGGLLLVYASDLGKLKTPPGMEEIERLVRVLERDYVAIYNIVNKGAFGDLPDRLFQAGRNRFTLLDSIDHVTFEATGSL